MVLGVLFIVSFLVSQYLIWNYAPIEATLGLVQKIFYLHLPLAWWGMISFFLVFVFSGLVLLRKQDKYDFWARASAEIGVLFSGLALITGSIWAKASWGVWWTWDPRLTTTLIMWFVYVGYLLLQGLELPELKRKKISAAVGIIAFLDVPLVFVSARIWRTVHPAVFAHKGGGLAPEMLYTLLASLVSFGFLWLLLLKLRAKQIALEQKLAGIFLDQLSARGEK